jgi:hypothetical protein
MTIILLSPLPWLSAEQLWTWWKSGSKKRICCSLLFVEAITVCTVGFHVSSMPPRSSPGSRSSFCPPNDSATYRDLLLFEERLKTNAANLQRRKSRYQCESLMFVV